MKVEEQMEWFWNKKLQQEKQKFYEEFDKKRMPYTLLTISQLRYMATSMANKYLEGFAGGKKLKNLELDTETMYNIYKELNNGYFLKRLKEGKKDIKAGTPSD